MLRQEDVQKVALLARLQVDDADLAKFTHQLTQIVEYIRQLEELPTEGVEPMAHAVELANVFAADEVQASLPRDAALANSAKRDTEFFRVPAVLGE